MSTSITPGTVSTSSKVIVLRKGKRKRTVVAEKQEIETEADLFLSESSSSEEDLATPREYTANNNAQPLPPAQMQQQMQMHQQIQHQLALQQQMRTQQPPAVEGEGECEEEEEEEEPNLFFDQEESIRLKLEQTREQMKYILENFTPAQMHRYETFRRVGFSRSVIKKTMQTILGHAPNPNSVIIMAGIAKVFAGEIVEGALEVAREWNEQSGAPLLPSHLMEAHRRMKVRSRLIPSLARFKKRKAL